MAKKEHPETKLCKHCKSEIAYDAKICPNCKKKQKGGGCLKVLLILVIAIVAIIALIMKFSGNQYKLSDDANSMSKEDYIAACEELDYKEALRSSEDYVGTKVKLEANVQQVVLDMESGESEYLLSMESDEDLFGNGVYMYYNYGDGEKLIEDDNVTVYGELGGTKSYTTVLGSEETVPTITAVYVEIDK